GAKDERRDIYVTRLEGGKWTTPAPVHEDGWRIDACPVNGPALAALGRRAAVAWFNAKADQGQAFVAFSSDEGRSFGTPVRIDDDASLGRVSVALLEDGSVAAGWIESEGERSQSRVRRVPAAGRRSASTTISSVAAGVSGYPRVARVGQDLLFAWTEAAGGSSRVRTAGARLDR